MDSAGIRLLFDLASHLQKSNIALKLIAPFESSARRLIQFSGLDSLVISQPGKQLTSRKCVHAVGLTEAIY